MWSLSWHPIWAIRRVECRDQNRGFDVGRRSLPLLNECSLGGIWFICFYVDLRFFVTSRQLRALHFLLSLDFSVSYFPWQIEKLIQTLDLIKNLIWFLDLIFTSFMNIKVSSEVSFNHIKISRREDEKRKRRRDAKRCKYQK